MSSAHRADDKRQQLCIKPTGFLVYLFFWKRNFKVHIDNNFNRQQAIPARIFMI